MNIHKMTDEDFISKFPEFKAIKQSFKISNKTLIRAIRNISCDIKDFSESFFRLQYIPKNSFDLWKTAETKCVKGEWKTIDLFAGNYLDSNSSGHRRLLVYLLLRRIPELKNYKVSFYNFSDTVYITLSENVTLYCELKDLLKRDVKAIEKATRTYHEQYYSITSKLHDKLEEFNTDMDSNIFSDFCNTITK